MNKVYLIGAGSGDPELLTLKGLRLLKKADVVIYDRLANPILLYLTNENSELIDAGKSPAAHKQTQNQIEARLIKEARCGKQVVRLKGGDPSIFGRVGEELLALRAAGVAYEVVPGITAASGASIYADIPITQRQIAERVLMITPRQTLVDLFETDFKKILRDTTVVLYMGVSSLDLVASILRKQQVEKTMPIAIIENGTRGYQRTLTTKLADFEMLIKNQEIINPALIIIGRAVTVRQGESWFESLPKFQEQLLVVTDQIPTLAEISEYTSEGADVWFTIVGARRQARFNSLDRENLNRNFSEIILKNNATIEALEKLKKQLGV
ncbi:MULTISPECIES: uroporphyrinogen-III C-methyltransferase [unclassified Enterococcus]|uniref:uroporphyrinogen-III C-methyltransferase n=1 Tax=unclassified Enterococcus TaxID=2608891 RepID=UPI0015527F54|nr:MULTISPECIES: uroporphyrinogen-III C-methyltransferase [unclassified Enterococcus]MBS7576403.1 uroporphyrinogen-III C-methyltransferase [Enterococcus sp. MMGLQ5-2]MBS7583635.1 uroporphyrinogen-III C-methyltransferase [Enterococcus sp. MMGLQ5-1]NPD11496.1 uroporphyrinogen-III C-methyltransferase [Enterococcus sp. MMGLQ5-1]NPD36240.1 uroporphyrinogen-III C-methyltransferase [Enterococcus sp. MMGLQ5-2]